MITCDNKVFIFLYMTTGYFERTIFVKVLVIIFTDTSNIIPEFTLYRPFFNYTPLLFLNIYHRLHKGIIIFIIFIYCHLKTWILNYPQKKRWGMNFQNCFSRNFVQLSKWCQKIIVIILCCVGIWCNTVAFQLGPQRICSFILYIIPIIQLTKSVPCSISIVILIILFDEVMCSSSDFWYR